MKTLFRVLILAMAGLTTLAAAEESNLRPFEHAGPIHEISVSSSASTGLQVTGHQTAWRGCVQYRLQNIGTTDVNVGFGATAATAQTNAADIPAAGDTGVAILVRAGSDFATTQAPNSYVSAKTASGTSTLRVGCGTGVVTGPGSSSVAVASTPTGTTATQVQGTAAVGAAAVGNPVFIAGRNQTNGNVQYLALGGAGSMALGEPITASDGKSASEAVGPADTSGFPRFGLGSAPYAFNGDTWDRQRNNTYITVLASAARTATVQSADLTNYNGKGLHLVIDVTAVTATPSITCEIEGKDALSGKYYDVLVGAAITATGTTVLKVYPGITASANASASDMLPRTFRVNCVHADADSITYSVGASLVN